MEIDFASQKIADAAIGEENGSYSKMSKIIRQKLGKKTTCEYKDIVLTLDALAAARSCADLPPSFHPHPLRGDRKGCFAVDIRIKGQGGRGTIRLIFRPNYGEDDSEFRIDNYKTIKKIVVEELCIDYHEQ